MIDDTGCPFCELWDEEIGSKYSKTEEGKLAPLIRHHYGSKLPDQIILNSEPIFTPTFILLEENREKFRFEGYLGEEFFWSFLSEYLQKLKNKKIKTDFKIGIIFAKLKITTGDDIMKSRQPSDLIVEVFAVAVSDLVALGLSREEAVLGLLAKLQSKLIQVLWFMRLYFIRNFILIL